MAQVEVDIVEVWNNCKDYEKRNFGNDCLEEVYEYITNNDTKKHFASSHFEDMYDLLNYEESSNFIKEHLCDLDEEHIVQYLLSLGYKYVEDK